MDFFKKNVDPNTFVKEFTIFFAKSFNWIDMFKNSHPNEKDKNGVENFINGIYKENNTLTINFNQEAELFESIYHFIQRKFHGTKVTNFGHEIFHISSFELKKAFLLSYFKNFLCNNLHSICMQCVNFSINCDMIVEQRNEIISRLSILNHEFAERSPLHEMVSYVLDGNFDLVGKIMKEKIMKPLENYVYEQTWIFKGKIQGFFIVLCNLFMV